MAAHPGLKLGTALWVEGGLERRALVAPLPSDPTRLVDLNRMERMRQAKLGEGEPEALADVLVPASLRRVLQGGTRALARIRQTLSYAEKWHRRRPLAEPLAPSLDRVRLLPCLPRPMALRHLEGGHLDRLALKGPGAEVRGDLHPTLALVGMAGGRIAGCCLALEDGAATVLGAWLDLDLELHGGLSLVCGDRQAAPASLPWQGLALPELRPAEVVLLPTPEWAGLHPAPGARLEVRASFEWMPLRWGGVGLHPTVQ